MVLGHGDMGLGHGEHLFNFVILCLFSHVFRLVNMLAFQKLENHRRKTPKKRYLQPRFCANEPQHVQACLLARISNHFIRRSLWPKCQANLLLGPLLVHTPAYHGQFHVGSRATSRPHLSWLHGLPLRPKGFFLPLRRPTVQLLVCKRVGKHLMDPDGLWA